MEVEKCAVCGEELFREVSVFGQTLRMRRACACRRAEIEQERKETEAYEKFNRSRDILELGYLDKGYAEYTFASTEEKDSKVAKDMALYAKNFAKAKEQNKGIFLYGNYGSGKTFYASCIANEVRKQGDYVLIGSSPQLVRYFTKDYGRNEEAVSQIRSYPLMVIDDIGMEKTNESSLQVMNEIIDLRYLSHKPLICTSNYPLNELYKGSGILGDRIMSRLTEMCVPYKVTGKDRRQV